MGEICSSGEGRVGVRQGNSLGKGMEVGQDAGGYKERWKPAMSEVGPDGEGPARWMASAPSALRLSWASEEPGGQMASGEQPGGCPVFAGEILPLIRSGAGRATGKEDRACGACRTW